MKTVLVVDDSPTLRKIVYEALQVLELKILEAENGLIAMGLLRENDVDLILLDWHMPEMDGYDFFVKMKEIEDYKKIPVMMLSAEDGRDNMLKAIRSGIRQYLTKPFTHEDLLVKVVHILKLNQ